MRDRAALGWGRYSWSKEKGAALVHEDDLAAFIEIFPHGKLFQHVGNERQYLRLAYGPKLFRVKPDLFEPVPFTPMPVGTAVKIVERNLDAVIEELEWHWVRAKPYYILRYDGKRHTRWYWDEELSALG